MGKLMSFQIINFAHAHGLFQLLSTVQQTKVSWAQPHVEKRFSKIKSRSKVGDRSRG